MPRNINYDNNLFYFYGDNKQGDSKEKRAGRKRGQALGEYALILVLAIGAFTVMQVYVRRELQGRYKDASDKIVTELRQAKQDTGLPLQYEPYYSAADITTETLSRGNSAYSPNGKNVEEINESTQREGAQAQYPYNDSEAREE